MPQPENSNPATFDYVDLWRQTITLAGELPGIHVTRFSSPPPDYQKPEQSILAQVKWTNMHDTDVYFDAILLTDEAQYIRDLAARAESSMGQPVATTVHGRTHTEARVHPSSLHVRRDEAPALSRQPQGRAMVVGEFLRAAHTIHVSTRLVSGAPDVQTARKEERQDAKTMQRLAGINLHLATLAGRDTILYEQTLAQAADWKPIHSIPPELTWLTGHKPKG